MKALFRLGCVIERDKDIHHFPEGVMKAPFRSGRMLLLAIMLVISCAGGAQAQQTGSVQKIRMGIFNWGANSIPFLVAREKGYYKDVGLDVEFVLTGGSTSIKAVLGGDLLVSPAMTSALSAIVGGAAPLKVLYSHQNKSHMEFWALPEVKSVKDLVGKKIGVGAPGDLTEVSARRAFAANKVAPDGQVYIAVGSGSDQAHALLAKSVAGTVTYAPYNIELAKRNFTRLVKFADIEPQVVSSIVVRADMVGKQPELLQKLVTASLKGLKTIVADKDFTVKVLAQYNKLSAEDASWFYTEGVIPLLATNGMPARDAIEYSIASIKKALKSDRKVTVEDVYDFRFIQKANQELKNWKP